MQELDWDRLKYFIASASMKHCIGCVKIKLAPKNVFFLFNSAFIKFFPHFFAQVEKYCVFSLCAFFEKVAAAAKILLDCQTSFRTKFFLSLMTN